MSTPSNDPLSPQKVGRGRGRSARTPVPPSPSLSHAASSHEAPSPATTMTFPSLTEVTDTLSSITSPSPTTSTAPKSGRGRGGQIKKRDASNVPEEPHVTVSTTTTTTDSASAVSSDDTDPRWKVNDRTKNDFFTNERPTKPDAGGQLGAIIEVMVNYFPITDYPRRGIVYLYDIKIINQRSQEMPRKNRRVVFQTWLQEYLNAHPEFNRNKLVFDNNSLAFTYEDALPGITHDPSAYPVFGPNRTNRTELLQFVITRVGEPVDFAHLDANNFNAGNNEDRENELRRLYQALSIVLHERSSTRADFVYNRTFYSLVGNTNIHNRYDLGRGKAIWQGFYSCLVFSKGNYKLLMNLDVSHSIFYKKQPFLDFLCEVMVQGPNAKRERKYGRLNGDDVLRYLDPHSNFFPVEAEYLWKQVKGLRVRSKNADMPIVYDIVGLAKSASEQTFEWKMENSRVVSVQEYYKEHHTLDLKFPSLPVLKMRNKSYLPMELVDIEPCRSRKITDEQRASMCTASTLLPPARINAINAVRNQQQKFEDDPFVRAWNLNVEAKMLVIPARVLPAPIIQYTRNYQPQPDESRNRGTWDIGRNQFFRPTPIPRVWAMMNLTTLPRNNCEEYYYELARTASERGINFIQPEIYHEIDPSRMRSDQLVQIFKDIIRENKDCGFMLIILPDEKNNLYAELKKLCDLELGIVTQMVKKAKAEKGKGKGPKRDPHSWDKSCHANLLLKINPKLDGTNSRLKVHNEIERFFSKGHGIMYVGADLSHLTPGSGDRRSSVAVVASADDFPNRYFKEIYKQVRPAELRGESLEYIVSMREIMRSLISKYDKHRGFPPKAIVVFRDGISEGEFDTVFEKELTAIREACADLSSVYRPALTYIVVSKRHRTRFFPDHAGNVQAGTVVDSLDVTNPVTFDFFLNSHYGALGTSRPTHYYVLYDDNKLTPDQVQMLTYALCYTHARCTKSIAIPAPVKYADLLAFRANIYIKLEDGDDSQSEASNDRPRIPTGTQVNVSSQIESRRIEISDKLAPDSPFFL